MQHYLPPVNFSFDGKHCYSDFGMVWIFTQRPASPQQEDPGITIGGMSGTIRLESEDDEPVPAHEGERQAVPDEQPAQPAGRLETLARDHQLAAGRPPSDDL